VFVLDSSHFFFSNAVLRNSGHDLQRTPYNVTNEEEFRAASLVIRFSAGTGSFSLRVCWLVTFELNCSLVCGHILIVLLY
jgi:hypothetical protein